MTMRPPDADRDAWRAKSIAPPAGVDVQPRCWSCGRLLIEWAARPWAARCPRCKATNMSEPPTNHASR